MGKWVHVIQEVTDDQVLCRNCGWVPKRMHSGHPRCKNAKVQHRGSRGSGHELHKKLRGDHCEVCGSNEQLCTDHDHDCCPGRYGCKKCIRGTLCSRCNKAEGLIRSMAPGVLDRLLKYMGG